jgi:hypothetical protein
VKMEIGKERLLKEYEFTVSPRLLNLADRPGDPLVFSRRNIEPGPEPGPFSWDGGMFITLILILELYFSSPCMSFGFS